jgi:predicted CXXCH cytochrome family protein
VLVLVVLSAGAVVRVLLKPQTYGQYGPYRGAAAAEARVRAPRHQGQSVCAKCHAKQARLQAKDAHHRVGCETCHGPGDRHSKDPKVKLRRPKNKEFCLGCHQVLAARPGSFPQIVPAAHYKSVGVKDLKTPCIRCHSPHEPLFMDRDLRTARLHPVVHRCRDCHAGPERDPATPRPASHPPIFECSYCHPRVVADFSGRTHKKVRCTTCHLFFKEAEYAGRIIRDADPRFCLLCHRDADFRADDAPPGIEWPDHREDMSEGPQDANKRCIDCHRDKIHEVPGSGSGEVNKP